VIDKDGDYNNIPATVEATSKFIFSNYQYIFCIMAHIQTYGLFRLPFYKNPFLMVWLTFECIMTLTFNFSAANNNVRLQKAFKMTTLPHDYRIYLCLLGLLNAVVLILYERYLVPHQSCDEEPVEVVKLPPDRMDSISQEASKDVFLPLLDKQATVLPKLRTGPPAYHQLNVAWKPSLGRRRSGSRAGRSSGGGESSSSASKASEVEVVALRA